MDVLSGFHDNGNIGSEAHRAKGMQVQKQSIVLLHNGGQGEAALLPLAPGKRIYTMGMGKADVEKFGYQVVDGNASASGMRPGAAGMDATIVRVQVTNPVQASRTCRAMRPPTPCIPTASACIIECAMHRLSAGWIVPEVVRQAV